jgi:hypothetical protein
VVRTKKKFRASFLSTPTAPCKAYRIYHAKNGSGSEAAVSFRQIKSDLRAGDHIDLFHLLKNLYLDELALGGGQGSRVLKRITELLAVLVGDPSFHSVTRFRKRTWIRDEEVARIRKRLSQKRHAIFGPPPVVRNQSCKVSGSQKTRGRWAATGVSKDESESRKKTAREYEAIDS